LLLFNQSIIFLVDVKPQMITTGTDATVN